MQTIFTNKREPAARNLSTWASESKEERRQRLDVVQAKKRLLRSPSSSRDDTA